MIARLASSLACAALVLGFAPACVDETIPLADALDPDAGDVDIDGGAKGCTKASDCDADSYCEFAKCDDQRGLCQHLPTAPSYDESPVCGCNNITYFNDTLRRSDGQSLRGRDWCPVNVAALCGGLDNKACPESEQFCARIFLGTAGPCPPPEAYGRCWILPPQCPSSPFPPHLTRCGEGGHCLDTCNAIKDGEPYRMSSHCQ